MVEFFGFYSAHLHPCLHTMCERPSSRHCCCWWLALVTPFHSFLSMTHSTLLSLRLSLAQLPSRLCHVLSHSVFFCPFSFYLMSNNQSICHAEAKNKNMSGKTHTQTWLLSECQKETKPSFRLLPTSSTTKPIFITHSSPTEKREESHRVKATSGKSFGISSHGSVRCIASMHKVPYYFSVFLSWLNSKSLRNQILMASGTRKEKDDLWLQTHRQHSNPRNQKIIKNLATISDGVAVYQYPALSYKALTV